MANGGLIACDGLYLNSLLLYIAIEQTIRSPFKCQFSIFIIQDTIEYRCSSDNYICLMLNRLIRRLIPKDFIYHDNNSINTIIIQNKNNNNSKNKISILCIIVSSEFEFWRWRWYIDIIQFMQIIQCIYRKKMIYLFLVHNFHDKNKK